MTAFPLAPVEPLAALPPYGAVTFAFERPEDGPMVDALVDRAFGPGRYAKTAERLREGNHPRLDLSICAWDGDVMAGATRQWPVLVGETPALFLGPFAVDTAWRSQRLGRALIERAVALNDAAGERLTVLVGDFSYFGQFGFEAAPPGRLVLPGPVDARRVLWRAMSPADLDGAAGLLRVPSHR